MLDTIFSGIAVILGAYSAYNVIRELSMFEYEYRKNFGYIVFHFLGVLLLTMAFAEMTMFFGDFKEFILVDNIGVCIQMLFMGFVSLGQSEKYYLREYSRRNNTELDTARIKELNEGQISIIVVIFVFFWL